MEKFNELVQHVILNQISTTECKICNVKLNNPSAEQLHYNSKKHGNKVNAYREDAIKKLVANQNAFPFKFSAPAVYAKPEVAKSEEIKCKVCKVDINSKSSLDTHVKEFPHTELLKLKRKTLKTGYKDEVFSINEDKYIYCKICNAVLQNPGSLMSHCQAVKHQTRFNNLARVPINDIPEYLCKWVFCTVCNINLDGTSQSDRHYAPYQQRYNFLTANSTYPPVSINPPITEEFKNLSITNNQTHLVELPVGWSNHDNNTNIKNQILVEIKKLTENLYYSNKVPVDEALRYMKKINYEVLIIKKNAEKNMSNNAGQTNVLESTDELNNQTIVNNVSQKITGQIDEPHKIDLNTKTELEKTVGKEQEGIEKDFADALEDLREDIMKETMKQEKSNCKEKIEVLAQIDILVFAIELLIENKRISPWQEVLDCLKTFNETVERETNHFFTKT